jgi:hypothetical protein
VRTDESQATRWAEIIVQAYAADTRPPLPDHLCARLTRELAAELDRAAGEGVPSTRWTEHVNPLLDEWERSVGVVGPRLRDIEVASGTALMAPRSEADHPLRPFGGQ